MMEFKVEGMTCGHCVGAVTKTVKLIDPEANVQVDLPSKKVSVESSKERAVFAEALTQAGYATR